MFGHELRHQNWTGDLNSLISFLTQMHKFLAKMRHHFEFFFYVNVICNKNKFLSTHPFTIDLKQISQIMKKGGEKILLEVFYMLERTTFEMDI